MPGYFSIPLILLSFVIASVAGFTAFESIEHTRSSEHPRLWTFLSGVTLGLGIWSMHFTGMMAWRPPFPTYYSVGDTLLSVVAAVTASWLAMRLTVNFREGAPQHHLLAGAALVGTGICGMHYLGMAAMHFSPPSMWSTPGVLLSYLIAVFASLGAMAMLQYSGADTFSQLRQIGASLAIGVAICGMHYIGMLAMMLPGGSVCVRQPGAIAGTTLGRAGVGTAMLFILSLLMFLAQRKMISARVSRHTGTPDAAAAP